MKIRKLTSPKVTLRDSKITGAICIMVFAVVLSFGTTICEGGIALTYQVAVSGEFAYVADGDNGLIKVNINTMNRVGRFDTASYALGVVISGDFAYVADGNDGLIKININTMQEAGRFATSTGAALGVAISGDFAYVADFTNGFIRVDIKGVEKEIQK